VPQSPILNLAAVIAAVLIPLPGLAQAEPSDVYKGKTVTLYIGNPAGGGYDLYGRLLARHIGRHLPGNPTVIASNMPGATGITCANFIYGIAPKDGTAIAILAQNIAEEQVFGTEGVRFDASKFSWIGRMSSNVEVSYVWHTVPVKTIDDVKTRETLFAATGPSSVIYPTLLNGMAGTRFKLIRGYPGTQDAHLAMQRGEVEGAMSSLNTLKTAAGDWLASGKINVIVQYALARHPDLADVPAVVELGKTPEDKRVLAFFATSATIGRSIVAPPDLAKDRLEMIRAAFDATMADEQFLADVRQAKSALEPLSGQELQKISERTVNLPAEERERARAARLRQ
jgi:tripartite-type tricarboxylate transporter receptor subunit TctC